MALKSALSLEQILHGDANDLDAHMQHSRHEFVLHYHVLSSDSPQKDFEQGLARCHAFLERRVPCYPFDLRGREGVAEVPLVWFIGSPWIEERSPQIQALMEAYLAAGYFDPNKPLNHVTFTGIQVQAPSSLEYVVSEGYTPQMVALLRQGADHTLVPEARHELYDGGCLVEEFEAGDFLAFIRFQTHSARQGMLAQATEILMKQSIESALASGLASSLSINPVHQPTLARPAARRAGM